MNGLDQKSQVRAMLVLAQGRQGPMCSKQDYQLASDAIVADTDKDKSSE